MAMKYPPVDPNINSAVYIWEYQFYANVPGISLDSEEYIRRVGVPMSGIKKLDDQLQFAYRQTYLNLAKLAEIVADGYVISVRNNDTKIIYDYIKHHLIRCTGRLSVELVPDEKLVEDLFKLDALSAIVYPHASPFFDGYGSASQFMRSIKQISNNAIGTILKPFDPKLSSTKKPTKHDLLLKADNADVEDTTTPLPDLMKGHNSVSDELRAILDRGFDFMHRGD